MRLVTIFLLCLAVSALGQPTPATRCDCPKAFEYVVQTIKTNYAGWADKVTPKNQAQFNQLTNQLRAKAPGASEALCFGLLARWTQQLNDHHTGVYVPDRSGPAYAETDPAKIRHHFANWEKLPFDSVSIKHYFDTKAGKLKPLEGIWQDDEGTYTVAIVANKTATRQYAGIILKADGVYWQEGQVKMDWSQVDSTAYGGLYYARDHSPAPYYAQLKNGRLAVSRQGDWIRLYPAQPSQPVVASPWKHDYSGRFELRSLDDSTMLLTLPDFDISHKPLIDSLLATHRAQLRKTPYLIIDVRANEGGWDTAYEPILDYLYTNPIIGVSSNLLVTAENLNKWKGHYQDPAIPADNKQYLGRLLAQMSHIPLGHYLNRPDDTTTRSLVYSLPRRVAVLTGRGCASSGEEFVLAARQSKKVTLLGENTAGILDYANVHTVDVAGSRFKLYYATSRTKRQQLIDNVGIAPDVRIPSEVTNWVEYARSYLRH